MAVRLPVPRAGSIVTMYEVAALNVYPVKGMRSMPVTERQVDLRGLHGDRRWLVTDPTGMFLTQRETPELAQFEAILTESHLHLRHDVHGEALVALPESDRWTVTVWGKQVQAVDAGDLAAEWLSNAFGKELRLNYMPDDSIRPTDPMYSTDSDHVSFADGFPILIANLATLDELNTKLASPVGIDRFRANIVVRASEPFEETRWRTVMIDGQNYRVAKPCGRCLVTTTDQLTGERKGPEPLETLAKDYLIGRWAVFGMNLIPEMSGHIKIGDKVSVDFRTKSWEESLN